MKNIIIIAILLVIIGLAALYVYRAKKKGQKCIGCPDSGSCSASKCEGGCNCGCGENK